MFPTSNGITLPVVLPDNSGPPESVEEVLSYFDIARWQFPGAEVVASTFDNFTAQLATIRSQLPVVTSEVGYTWIMGE